MGMGMGGGVIGSRTAQGLQAAGRVPSMRELTPAAAAASAFTSLLFRGLRLKAGVDYGSVSASVHPALGRMSYM